MNHPPHILPETLLAKMDEADTLAAAIRTIEPGEERLMHIIRWALVADEAMALIIQAEEILSEQALHDLRICVNANQPERWSVYRTGDRRIKAITGKELWEHPMFTTSLGELLNTSLNE